MKQTYRIIALVVIFLILLGVFAPRVVLVRAVSTMPAQLTLKNKEAEKLYYFDPLPTFLTPGILNEIDAIVYKMGDVIQGEINELQTSSWFAALRDVSGSNISLQSLAGGKNFSLVTDVAKDGKYFVVATDSLTAPTWTLSKEIYIKYKVEVTKEDVKCCPAYTCTLEGKITRGTSLYLPSSVNVNIAQPDKKLVSSGTSLGDFSLTFSGTSILGLYCLYVSDGYPAVSPDNDAIVYAFIPNYSTITWILKEVVPGAPLYNDEESNLYQSIVFYLEDSNGNPVSGMSSKFYIGMSWISPQVKEISEGVYKVYGGTLKGSSVFFYVKDIITSNTITKNLNKLTFFNPYIQVDSKYSPSPYGSGPYTDSTLGKSVFDFLPPKIGNSLELKAGVYPIPNIVDPGNPKYTLKDNYYIYKINTSFSPSLETHSTSVNDPALFYVKDASNVYAKVEAVTWKRANQDSTPTWQATSPNSYNACCVKNTSQTFRLLSTSSPCDFGVSPSSFVIGKEQDLSIQVTDSFSVVHLYMVSEEGSKLSDAFTVSYKGGLERKTLTDLWYNPLHISGTNITELPVTFSYDDNVDVIYSGGKITFKKVKFNYITNYPLSENRVIVEIFAKNQDKYPYCGIYMEKIEVTPEIKTIEGTYEVISSGGKKASELLVGIKESIIIYAPFAYQNVFFSFLYNGKPLENYNINASYIRVADGTYMIAFDNALPYDEEFSPNTFSIFAEAFSGGLISEEVLSLNIKSKRLNRENNPPQIAIVRPKDSLITNQKVIIVKGIVTDDSAVSSLLINGIEVPFNEKGEFEKEITLNEGENTIAVKAVDAFQNEKIISLKVILDTVPPTFTFDYPSETTHSSVVINGTTEKEVTVSFRDKELENKNGSFSVEVPLVDGKNYFYFSFEDPAGNKSKTTIEILKRSITTIILEIGKPTMFVNSNLQEIDPGRITVPIIKNNRTLLPIRAVIEALGGYVSWDNIERKVSIFLGTNKIELWIGRNVAKVNGVEKLLDSDNPNVVPEIINGRTMLPMRFIAENLGAMVEWDDVKKIVRITFVR